MTTMTQLLRRSKILVENKYKILKYAVGMQPNRPGI